MFLIDDFGKDAIISNKVDAECYRFKYLKNYIPTLKHGMSFTQLVHDVFKNEKLDIEFSKFYSATTSKGYISISIDPIDYMLMSLNRSGWTSCHTLHHFEEPGCSYGCYSAGIFSYMCDSASIIAFKHSQEKGEDIFINDTKVNAINKNWRQMVYIDMTHHAFIGSRQYPCESLPAQKSVQEMVQELLVKKYEIKDEWKNLKGSNYTLRPYIKNSENSFVRECNSLHYNDILNGFTGSLTWNTELEDTRDIFVVIGSFPTCPICGASGLDDPERPFCSECLYELDL